jgi:hypothetical protein
MTLDENLQFKRSPLEDIFSPFTFGFVPSQEGQEYFETQIESIVQRLQRIREIDSREYASIVNSLRLLLLLPNLEQKIELVLGIPSLSIGFGVIPFGIEIGEFDSPQVRNIKIAEYIAIEVLSKLGEGVNES